MSEKEYVKFETVKREIEKYKWASKHLEFQIAIPKKIDKCGLEFQKGDQLSKSGNYFKATIQFGARHGYYGDSSCSDDMSDEVAECVFVALRTMHDDIVHEAIKVANKRARQQANIAKDEAEEILKLCNGEIQ
ncbi:MAG: hypothetical protein KAS32_04240 [Candidatus Peribacteraceae bacterium]|nr:hypothetical protein [Candidatus Peribacteraceae bacterium]